MAPTTDKHLLQDLAAGDLEALGALYDAYGRRIYHVLVAQGVGDDTAEDLLQNAFLALLDRGRGVVRIANVQAYLIQTARNMASRARRRARRSLEVEASAVGSEDAAPVGAADTLAVRDALRQLPAEQAEVVVLKVWHELTFTEIAEALSIPPDAAASRYRYALQKLRVLWREDNDDP